MVDPQRNLCDVRKIYELNAKGGGMCMKGRQAFMKDVSPLIEIRHEIGAAKIKEDSVSHVNKLKKRLAHKASRLERQYQENLSRCEDYDVVACGYVIARDSYVELFGPLGNFGKSDSLKYSMRLKPFNQAFLFTQGFDGVTSEVMFDTGTENTVFSPTSMGINAGNFNKLFEFKKQGAVIYENTGLKYSFGGMSYDPIFIGTAVMVDNLGAAEDGHTLNAMIGVDYILRASFAVDYDEGILTLGHDVDEVLNGSGWEWMPFYPLPTDMNNYQISVLIYLNERPILVIFDSGSSFTYISQHCLEGEPLVKGDALLSFYGIHGGMSTKDEVTLKFGSYEQSTHVSVLPTEHPSVQMYLGDQTCGCLGLDEQEKFNYIIDPDVHGIYFKPRKYFSDTPIFYFGIVSEKTRYGALIRHVEEGSPAELADIRPGDLVTEIDGRDITRMSPIALSDLQWTDKDEIAVDILREGSMHCLVMKRIMR